MRMAPYNISMNLRLLGKIGHFACLIVVTDFERDAIMQSPAASVSDVSKKIKKPRDLILRHQNYPNMLFPCRVRNFCDRFQELFSKLRCNHVLKNHVFRLL